MDFNDISALVTGGGSGIGAAVADALGAAGVRVVVMDRNAEGAQAVAKRVGGVAMVGDVTSEEDLAAAVDEAKTRGPLRLAVACAGIGTAHRVVGRQGPHPLDQFSRVVSINLTGTFNLLRLAAAAMIDNPPDDGDERGLIVATASVAAFEGQIGQCAYAASKGGIVAMTLPAARELAKFGIRVNTIAPGLIDTPLMAGFSDEVRESLGKLPLFPKRLGKPSEFADLVLAIARNRLINGETIRLDGALRLAPQ